MKPPTIFSLSAASLLAGATLFSAMVPGSAQASDVKFTCGTSRGVPATMAQTSRGSIPIIRWVSYAFGGDYTPLYRCQVVSPKFQKYYADGKLNFVKPGWANSQPIVCVANSKEGTCSWVLFTLKQGSDPWVTLQRLMDVRVQAGPPLNESSAGAGSANSGQYIDMNEFLNTAPVESVSASETLPTQQNLVPAPSTPAPSGGLW
ncbi:MAG: COP23 domain-containing protein [Thermosynechococcaceae cyanobacterium]